MERKILNIFVVRKIRLYGVGEREKMQIQKNLITI